MLVRLQLDAAALTAKKPTPPDRSLGEYAELQRFLSARDSTIVIPNPATVCKKAAIIEARSRVFLKLFRTLQPVIGFQVCYYGGLGLAFNIACHRYGVPSVDLQHGIQGDLHFAYGRWNRVPEDGYALLPSAFWCWSRAETDAIARWSQKTARHRAVVGGNLLLQSWRDGAEFAQDYDPGIRELKKRSGKATHVLYTIRDPEAGAELAEIFDLVRATADSYHWWIRLHPAARDKLGEVQRLFRRQGLANLNVAEATFLPLYVLLKHVDLHVTGRSTTVIEAELFGVPSVLTDPEGAEVYAEQIRSGWASSARGREATLAAIEAQLRWKSQSTPTGSAEQLDADASRRALLTLIEESRASRRSESVSCPPEP